MSEHQHEQGPISFGFNDKHDWIPIYTCTVCGYTDTEPFPSDVEESDHLNHTDYIDGCFGCKLLTLQVNTGDAGRAENMSAKRWDGELNAYAAARSEGIQPAGTTMRAVQEARAASDKLGVAYNAESMPAATKITKQTANVMKETGAI